MGVSTSLASGQLPLIGPDLRPIVPIPAQHLSIEEQFQAFHRANPQVYDLLRSLALAMVRAGRDRIGAKMLWERLRWEYALQTAGEYRLNNNLTSRYARLLMDQEPELAGRFETRELRS